MKHRDNGIIRRSISAKLNIMIVMIILVVAGLLMIISNRAYRANLTMEQKTGLSDAPRSPESGLNLQIRAGGKWEGANPQGCGKRLGAGIEIPQGRSAVAKAKPKLGATTHCRRPA